LPGAEERGDGPLNIAIVDRLMHHDARGPDHLGGGESDIAFDRDTVDHRRAFILGEKNRRPSEEEGDGGKDRRETLHQSGVGCAGSADEWRPQAWGTVSARKTSRSPSGATSTSISSPRPNSPMRIFSLSGSSM
jgi:hypothetical protein